MPRGTLNRRRIVEAAFTLLDEGGLEAITARALAERLGVQAGALYHHLPDMRALLDELATAQLREILAEPLHGSEWAPMLRSIAERIRTVLSRHPDGARVFAGSRILDPVLVQGSEQPLAVLTAAGLPLDHAVWTLQAVLHYTTGTVIEEQHRRHDEPEAYRPESRRAVLDAEAAPLTAASTEALLGAADERFAWGVDLLIEGVRAALRAR